jgi:hypothetical protein
MSDNFFATRADLAAAATSLGSAVLAEPGRTGLFIWSGADHSGDVAADAREGIYVPPASDATGATGAWVRQHHGIGEVEWWGAVGDGATDDKPALQAALDAEGIETVRLGAQVYGVESRIVVPEGKTLKGIGPHNSIIKVLPGYDLSGSPLTKRHFVVTCELEAKDISLENFAVDGNHVGLGLGIDMRVTLIAPQGTGFLVHNCHAYNGSGYALYARGETGQEASGTFRSCKSWNCDTLMETAFAFGVTFEDCHSHSGDETIPVQEAIIPWSDSRDITFIRCSFRGKAGAGIGMTPFNTDLAGICFIACEVEMSTENMALNIESSAYKVYAQFIGCVLKSPGDLGNASLGARFNDCEIDLIGTTIEGARGISVGDNVTVRAQGSRAIGRAPTSATYVTRGLVIEGTSDVRVTWAGGTLEAYGSATVDYAVAYIGDVQITRETAVIPAQADTLGGPVPDGGTTGQVLAKASSTDQDLGWADTPLSLIEEYSGTGASGTKTFTIPPGYKALRLLAMARSDTAAVATNLNMRFNGDAAANYDNQFHAANGGTSSASANAASDVINLGVATGSMAPAGEHGMTEAQIPMPDSTEARKQGQSNVSYKTADAAASLVKRQQGFWWRNTDAITSISLTLAAGNFTTSSYIRLEGIR